VPAASAGLRLAPARVAGRASLRGAPLVREVLALRADAPGFPLGLLPFEWPLRLPHAGVPALAVLPLAVLAPLAGAVPARLGRALPALPLDRDPLAAPCALPFPFPLLLLAPFALHRVPAAGRASALARRAGRLLDELCAGLRSREWLAGRLKCGRAAAGFPLAAGLRDGVLRAT